MRNLEAPVSLVGYFQMKMGRACKKSELNSLSYWNNLSDADMRNLANGLKGLSELMSFADEDELPMAAEALAAQEMELNNIEAELSDLTNSLCRIEQRLGAFDFMKGLYELFLKCVDVSEESVNKFPQAFFSLRTLTRQVLNPSDDNMSPTLRCTLLTSHPDMNKAFFASVLAWLSEKKKVMRQFLLGLWNATFAWSHKLESQSLTVTVRETGQLVHLCNALDLFDMLDLAVRNLSVGIREMFLSRFCKAGPCDLRYETYNGVHTLQTFMPPIIPVDVSEQDVQRRSNAVGDFFNSLSEILDVTAGSGIHLGFAVGEFLGDSLMEGIVAVCLKPFVSLEGSNKLSVEKQLDYCRTLERNLRNRKLLNTNSDVLQQFMLEYDAILCEKECERLISAFRATIDSPLQPVKEVGSSVCKLTDSEIGWPPTDVQNEVADLGPSLESFRASISSVLAPPCSVSAWLVNYIELIESTLRTAFEASHPQQAVRYFEVTRAAVLLFIVHGKTRLKEASSSAYLAAIHFNNMCYLARSLLELNVDLELNLAGTFHCSPFLHGFTYLDLTRKLRGLAVCHLDAFLECQSGKLVHDLNLASGFAKVRIGGRPNICQQTVKNCVKLLLCIHNEWNSLLPGHVMRVSYGRLVDCLLSAVISNVLSLEDITSKEATRLDDMFIALKADIEFLFSSEKPDSPEVYCEAWPRMNELLFILENNLKGIEERWNNGSGPLATFFTTDELRRLIRAIFQNTEQRAALLSKLTRSYE
uniref:Centromere/kinetochore protein zw10 homolog n=1 Tax=Trichuris muris TaxID=70415 RepID=A0A5S6QEK0_TRIMR